MWNRFFSNNLFVIQAFPEFCQRFWRAINWVSPSLTQLHEHSFTSPPPLKLWSAALSKNILIFLPSISKQTAYTKGRLEFCYFKFNKRKGDLSNFFLIQWTIIFRQPLLYTSYHHIRFTLTSKGTTHNGTQSGKKHFQDIMKYYLKQCWSRCLGRGNSSSAPSAGAASVSPASLSLNKIMLTANQKGRAGEKKKKKSIGANTF